MNDRVIEAYSHYKSASEKFNYFVAGASGTLCAYLVQNWNPIPIGTNPETLEIFSIIFLAFSTVYGFRLFENEVMIMRNNVESLEYKDKRSHISRALASGSVVVSAEGEVDREVLQEHSEIYKKRIDILESIYETSNKSIAFSYRWRNWLLALGSVVYLISKVARAYFYVAV